MSFIFVDGNGKTMSVLVDVLLKFKMFLLFFLSKLMVKYCQGEYLVGNGQK